MPNNNSSVARKRAQVEAAVDAGDQQCFGALTATERRELLKLLEKCIHLLEDEAAAH